MFEVKANISALLNVEQTLRRVGNQAPHAVRRAINHTGDKMVTLVTRALAGQTGVKYGVVKRALRVQRATYDRGSFVITARGSYLALKEFSPRQTKQGVTANAWGKRRLYKHAFIVPTLGGQVFVRMGDGRLPIKKLWGPALPVEMVKGDTAAVFLARVAAELPARVEHEVNAILEGHAPRG